MSLRRCDRGFPQTKQARPCNDGSSDKLGIRLRAKPKPCNLPVRICSYTRFSSLPIASNSLRKSESRRICRRYVKKLCSLPLTCALLTLSNLSLILIGTDMNLQTWRITPVGRRPSCRKTRRSFVIRSRGRFPTPTAMFAALVAAACRRRYSTTSGLQHRAGPESDEQRRHIHSRTHVVRRSESTAPRSYLRMESVVVRYGGIA